MSKGVADIENHCIFSGDASELLTLIKSLTQYEDHNASFGEVGEELSITHLAALMEKKEFRSMLERKKHKRVLDTVLKSVKYGHKVPNGRYIGPREVRTCNICAGTWVGMSDDSYGCPSCRIEMEKMEQSTA